ncbi:hypothetical protein ASE49_06260 [Novosphingobium sp. Leaf2]|nr:hypothetical protein ASE49_06260 [Novosphingobium sp. Leaf2]
MLPVTATAAPEKESEHVVASGETLNGIANRAGVSAQAVMAANGLKAPYVVKIGQTLKIPHVAKPAKPTKPAKAAEPAKVAAPSKAAAPAASTDQAKADAEEKADQAALDKAAATAAPAAKKVATNAVRVIQGKPPLSKTTGPETETEHLVAPGETLGVIAERAHVPRVLIIEANALPAPYAVRVGQTLKIPRTRRHQVKPGDSSFSIAMDYAVPWEQIALANSLSPSASVKPGQVLLIPTLLNPPTPVSRAPASPAKPTPAPAVTKTARFAWPLTGPVRRGFSSSGDYHDGLDIAAPKGTTVRAAGAGTVVFAGKEKDQFGNLVVIDHGDGWHTAYAFLSRITVKQGASVVAGERVGLVGNTGKAKGDELHFEVRREGKPVDPVSELPKVS